MSMFLGTTFQQVVVLVVVFLGGHILGEYLRVGADGEFDVLVIGMILAALTLVLALKVPSIVNPKGQGMFQGFGQIGMMAIAGATMIGGLGIGAAAGALGGLGGAAGGAAGAARSVGARMNLGGGGGGDGGGGDEGAGGARMRVGGGPRPSGGTGGANLGGGTTGGFPGGSGSSGVGSGGGGATPGSERGGEGGRRPGFLERTYTGARRGARRAGGINTRLADLSSGRFLFRGGSTGDDSAVELSRLRREQSQRADDQSAAYDRMADVLDKLNQRLP